MKIRWGLLGWILLGVLALFSILKANQASDRLKELRRENAALTATNNEQAQLVAFAEERVTEADRAASAVDVEAIAKVEAANRRATTAEAKMRDAILGQPDLIAMFEDVTVAHEAELQAERDKAARQETRMLAQITARDGLIARQRDQIQTQASLILNLREQVSALDPPFFVGLFRDAPKLVLAAAVGVVAGAALAQ